MPKAEFERAVMGYLQDIRERFDIAYRPDIAFTFRGKETDDGELTLAGITRIAMGRREKDDRVSIELKIRAPRGHTVPFARFAVIVVHELFHTVVPIISGSLVWSEGVTDFCAHWHLGLQNDLPRKRAHVERFRHSNPTYYKFKRPYIVGANAMLDLFQAAPRKTVASLRAVIRDANRDRATFFAHKTKGDIVGYDPAFEVFFRHGKEVSRRWNTETPV